MNAHKLYYTDTELRKDEDGLPIRYVYVPLLDEWMPLDEFHFQKAAFYDPAMEDVHAYEHDSEDFLFDEDWEDEDDDWEDEGEDDEDEDDEDEDNEEAMTYQEAVKDFNRTGINHSNYDLNDYDEINENLGFEFFKPRKQKNS